jgi:hypothetical protein
MTLLSFAVKEWELKARTKDHTVRPFSHKRFEQLWNAKVYQVWWKSRTKRGYKLYNAIQDGKPYLIEFEKMVYGQDIMFNCIVTPVLRVTKDEIITGERVRLTSQEFLHLAKRDGFHDAGYMMLHFIHLYGCHAFTQKFIGVPFKGMTEPL